MPSLSDAPVGAQNLTKDNIVELITNKIQTFIANYREQKLTDKSLPLIAFQLKHFLLLWMAAQMQSYKSDILEKFVHKTEEFHQFIDRLNTAVKNFEKASNQFAADLSKLCDKDVELDETRIIEIKDKSQKLDGFLSTLIEVVNAYIDLISKMHDLNQQLATKKSPYEDLCAQGKELLYILATDESGIFVEHEELIEKLGKTMAPLIPLAVQAQMRGNNPTDSDKDYLEHQAQAIELKEQLQEPKRLLTEIQASSDNEQMRNLLTELLAQLDKTVEKQIAGEPVIYVYGTRKVGQDGITYEGFGNQPSKAKSRSRSRWGL